MEQAHSFSHDPRTWVAVAFVIFFVIFGRTLWKALSGILDKRADQVRAELAEAAKLRTEAEAMLAEATSRREAALIEAQHVLEAARAEAFQVTEFAAYEAKLSAERSERMALERIAAAEKQAVLDVRRAAADIASVAAGQVIRNTLGPDRDAQLVDHAIAGLPIALTRRTG